MLALLVTSPITTTPFLWAHTSTATREVLSCFKYSSKIVSAILSHNLSGCPGVTDSDVNNFS